ncbi:MAG: 30S ribosome-binding factor RbfA [Alphaproteobacteria bacterium]
MARSEAPRMPSQRQLRVGEELRNALAQIFALGETHVLALDSSSITVSEVRISPDLKNATAYVMPLNGNHKEEVMVALKEHGGHIRSLMSKRVILRHVPKLNFKLDVSYEVAGRINQLLNSERVRADVVKKDDE